MICLTHYTSYLSVSSVVLLPILEKLSVEEDGILSRSSGPDQPDGGKFVIRHDALAPAILDWRGRYLHDQELEKKKQQEKEAQQTSSTTIKPQAAPQVGGGDTKPTPTLGGGHHTPKVVPPYNLIRDLLGRSKVVPFLGPGASASARPSQERWEKGADFLPTGYEFAQFLGSLINFPYEDASDLVDLATVASYVEEVAGRRILVEHLHDALAGRKFQPSEIHKYLAHVAGVTPLIIITANYDTLMEQALEAEGIPYDLVVNVSQRDRADRSGAVLWWEHGATEPQWLSPNQLSIDVDARTVVYKIYGSVDRTNIERSSYVITDIDYVESFQQYGGFLLSPLILSSLHMKSALFLGWSLRGWTNRHFIQKVMGAGRNAPRSWSVLYAPSSLEIIFADRMNIKVFDQDLNEFAARIRE